MEDRLRTIEREHGVFLRSELRDLGYDDQAVRTALRLRIWVRVRHGAYCFYDTWAQADAVQRHLIRARAVMRSLDGRVVLSHVSSLVVQDIPVWGADLSKVHVTRVDGASGRVEGDVVHHAGDLTAAEVVDVLGMRTTSPTRAVLEAGTVLSVESSLVSIDAALHAGLTTADELRAGFERMEGWPGTQALQLTVRMADAGAASPGESRSRYLFWTQNLPAPQTQYSVVDAEGELIGITDFAWPEHGVLGEFDGKVKYGRLLKPGQDPGDVVFSEKRREDRLREVTGFVVLRLVWAELATPVATGRRFGKYLGRAA